MKSAAKLLAFMATIAVGAAAEGASDGDVENEIRKLEQEIVSALLKNDLAGVRKHQAPDHVVNNPFGKVVDARSGPIHRGQLTYSAFVREPERVIVRGDTVIVMGHETVTPSGSSPDAGKTIQRRFTNVWMRAGDRWLIVARHANAICDHENASK